ncbi:MAG: hypothetical protein IJQ32_06945 [Paludibacteraceae bacterium]|nr:hypothetical protein [Paludibacteraceae bacterium]
MAKAELDILLNKLSGRLTGDSKFYDTHRNGRTVISNYPKHKDPKSITPAQKANSSAFAQLSKQAALELSDPDKRAHWQSLYEAHLRDRKAPKYYATLRGFVFAQLKRSG